MSIRLFFHRLMITWLLYFYRVYLDGFVESLKTKKGNEVRLLECLDTNGKWTTVKNIPNNVTIGDVMNKVRGNQRLFRFLFNGSNDIYAIMGQYRVNDIMLNVVGNLAVDRRDLQLRIMSMNDCSGKDLPIIHKAQWHFDKYGNRIQKINTLMLFGHEAADLQYPLTIFTNDFELVSVKDQDQLF